MGSYNDGIAIRRKVLGDAWVDRSKFRSPHDTSGRLRRRQACGGLRAIKFSRPPSLFELLVPISVHRRLTSEPEAPVTERLLELPFCGKRARPMLTAKQYRAKAAQYTELLKAARLPAETREFRKLEQSYLTLAENEEWLADNPGKTNSPGADENWYGDAILARQGRPVLAGHGTDAATQSTAIPAMVQQLFDDAGSMGGMLQTATLRGQIVRFLHKHRDDDFR